MNYFKPPIFTEWRDVRPWIVLQIALACSATNFTLLHANYAKNYGEDTNFSVFTQAKSWRRRTFDFKKVIRQKETFEASFNFLPQQGVKMKAEGDASDAIQMTLVAISLSFTAWNESDVIVHMP